MRSRCIRRGIFGFALVGSLVLTACGEDGDEPSTNPAASVFTGIAGPDIEQVDPSILPGQLLLLDVEVEDVTDQYESVTDTYVEALTMFSFRREDLLQATLQISRLADQARLDDEQFRRTLIGRIGSTEPIEVIIGDQTVWFTTGTDQRVQAWFVDRHLFILSIRADYDQPRRLLRQLLEVRP